MNRSQHWDAIYTTKAESELSWFEPTPTVSLRMIASAHLAPDACAIDIGGGESRLVDELLARGVRCLAVLDVSHAALERTRARLGREGSCVSLITADVTAEWSFSPVQLWHDRAVFHFLTEAGDRARYRERMAALIVPGGTAIVATFAPDGPEQCSGLPVVRYSPESLAAELGEPFVLVQSEMHAHRTPGGKVQRFQYSRFASQPAGPSRVSL